MILDRIDAEGPPASLRFVRSCSSALVAGPHAARRGDASACPMLEAYGMTEASHQMASNPLPPGQRKPGSVGVPSGVEIRIVDSAWPRDRQGRSGEVVIRGPGVTAGYLDNPKANAESFFDGWFRTGDRGSFDADGYLRLEGRLKEMILRGGENISPYEIEEVLLGHPAVVGRDLLRDRRREVRRARRRGRRAERVRGGARADRLLPRAARRVQGPGGRARPRRDPAHADREGAAEARRRGALGEPGMRFAILGRRGDRRLRRRSARAGRHRRDADRAWRRTCGRCRTTACRC